MDRRDLLKTTLAGPLIYPLIAAAQTDDVGETPTVKLPVPKDFITSAELTRQIPILPLSKGSPPREWNGEESPELGSGPCGIAKEFGPSGPTLENGETVLEYLDDDDVDEEGSKWLTGLQKEFGGEQNELTEYYELGIAAATKPIRSGQETKFIGYGERIDNKTVAQWPGPLIFARVGHPMVVRFINEVADYMSIHLHGAHGPAHSDGHPAFVVPRPTKKDGEHTRGYWQNHRDYFYPHTIPAHVPPDALVSERPGALDETESPSTMWYHDHSMDVTGPHVMFGLAGFMPIFDDLELRLLHDEILPFCRPRGGTYLRQNDIDFDKLFEDVRKNPFDVPIVLQDRRLSREERTKNQLLYTVKGHNGFLGDEVFVNGVEKPRFAVAPVKYRFRILNGSNARFYKLALYAHFEDPENPDNSLDNLIPLRKEMSEPAWFRIGKDTWLYPEAIRQDKVLIGMANRADVVIDFAAIRIHFKVRAENDVAFKNATHGKKLAIYLANVLDQDSGRGPRAKLDDGNSQELPPVESFQNVNVPNDREDSAKGELSKPWLLMKFSVAESLNDLGTESDNVFRELGYQQLEELPNASVRVGTPLRPHRPILREEISLTREVVFERGNGIWQINGKVVDEFLSNFVPQLNDAECWILENGGGGWWHPIHIHLESHQQMEYLAEVSISEIRRLLAHVMVRFEQAARDEEIIRRHDHAEQLRGLLRLLKDSVAVLRTELETDQTGVVDLPTTRLTTVTNDDPSLQRITRAALTQLEVFAERRNRELDGSARPAEELPLAAYLRLKSLYGDVRGVVVDLNADAVMEAGRLWTRVQIPPWDRYKSDTTILGPNTRVKVFIKFRTFDGPFVFHCHNLEHEDMRMMFTVDPRFTPSNIAKQGSDVRRQYHELEHIVRYRHPFRFSGDDPKSFDLRPHIDSGPPDATKMPPWDEEPGATPKLPRAHPIWGGWDQDL